MDGRIVLVVDDDDQLRHLVARVIAGAGYRVLMAGNGREALAVASTIEGQLGLLVTDVRMPEMDGITLAQKLSGSKSQIPVVFMSGYAPEADAVALPGPLLRKPFSHEALLDLVRRMLNADDGVGATS
jgi:two-component system, cell cycle sensor histidine kinase and response regulator CckA